MIINTGARTDTVQYYSEWLLRRFREGFVFVRNPMYPDQVTRYELSPNRVDAVLFCSKNYAPILPRLHEITDRYRCYFHYTITAYGRDIEPGVPPVDESMETLLRLSETVGRQRVSWRYDPVLLTDRYTVGLHLEAFARMAERLSPYIDRCIFSFVELYRKLRVNMPELRPMSDADKNAIAKGMGETAARLGLWLQACGTNGDLTRYGIHPSGCATADILGRANGCRFRERKHRAVREGCRCMESRDIGAYDSCPNGCRYCYANQTPGTAAANYRTHDPASPILLGTVGPADHVHIAVQTSDLEPDVGTQLSLF